MSVLKFDFWHPQLTNQHQVGLLALYWTLQKLPANPYLTWHREGDILTLDLTDDVESISWLFRQSFTLIDHTMSYTCREPESLQSRQFHHYGLRSTLWNLFMTCDFEMETPEQEAEESTPEEELELENEGEKAPTKAKPKRRKLTFNFDADHTFTATDLILANHPILKKYPQRLFDAKGRWTNKPVQLQGALMPGAVETMTIGEKVVSDSPLGIVLLLFAQSLMEPFQVRTELIPSSENVKVVTEINFALVWPQPTGFDTPKPNLERSYLDDFQVGTFEEALLVTSRRWQLPVEGAFYLQKVWNPKQYQRAKAKTLDFKARPEWDYFDQQLRTELRSYEDKETKAERYFAPISSLRRVVAKALVEDKPWYAYISQLEFKTNFFRKEIRLAMEQYPAKEIEGWIMDSIHEILHLRRTEMYHKWKDLPEKRFKEQDRVEEELKLSLGSLYPIGSTLIQFISRYWNTANKQSKTAADKNKNRAMLEFIRTKPVDALNAFHLGLATFNASDFFEGKKPVDAESSSVTEPETEAELATTTTQEN